MTLLWDWRMTGLFAFVAISLCPVVNSDFLQPELIGFVDFKGWKITASSTCGVEVDSSGKERPMREIYCQIDGAHDDSIRRNAMINTTAYDGQFCSFCDPKAPETNHAAVFALDPSKNWWQSPPLSRGQQYREVNLTIDLGQELSVYYIIIRPANSPRPAVWVLEKSRDYGVTYTPWQYFATSLEQCADVFKIHPTHKYIRDDTAICDTQQSKLIEPQKSGVNFDRDEIIISLVKYRPSAETFYRSQTLQDWTKATNIRFRFLQPNTHKADLMSLASEDPSVMRRYFYSVRQITMGSRCVCNGHAVKCNNFDSKQNNTLICECLHNTCGIHCDSCCNGFVQKKWRPAKPQNSFICEPCNCFGHSDDCQYNPEVERKGLSLDIHGYYNGGGVCKNCMHNTAGINCDKCKPGYYHPSDIPLNSTNSCKLCSCSEQLHKSINCRNGDGQCECKPQYTRPKCDSCMEGFYSYPACHSCKCDSKRTESTVCDVITGQCKCKPSFTGRMCETCANGYYGFPHCQPCKCNEEGAESNMCDKITGQCSCKVHYGGEKCSKCKDGYFDFPKCTRCTCDVNGTQSDICNKKNGICLCKEGYHGKICDHCQEGRYNYPHCTKCDCSQRGSQSVACDNYGYCSCHPNFLGMKCDECNNGYYNYPSCFNCYCNSMGSTGRSCDGKGKCQCKPYFDGMQCNKCKEGYYGFPNCTACNCDPKGVRKDKIGCNPLPNGEFCPCKKNVKGRHCDECEENHWNLLASNPEGCEDCNCFTAGVLGQTKKCDPYTGKCPCKYLVESDKCQQCQDGTYNLRADNLLGCTDCDCSIGGSFNKSCNNSTGKCHCKPNIEGQRCSTPVDGYYFPTLHQYQFEAEDGFTSSNDVIQYSSNQNEFPGYSWKGYVVFSEFQSDLKINVEIEKPNKYQMVFHCLNLEDDPILVVITLIPKGVVIRNEKTFQVMIPPRKKPTFITIFGSSSNLTSPIFWDRGEWSLNIKSDSQLFLDYIVIIPLEYYQATVLAQNVNKPCTMQEHSEEEISICRHFCYPKVSQFHMAIRKSKSSNKSKLHLRDCFDDDKAFGDIGKLNIPPMGSQNNDIQLKLEISKHGEYVLVIIYYTPGSNSTYFDVEVMFSTSKGKNYGKITLYPCNYSSFCRQVIKDRGGKIKIFHFYRKDITLSLTWKGKGFLNIASIVTIPKKKWSLGYIEPKPACVMVNGKCLPTLSDSYPHSKMIHFSAILKHKKTKIMPYGLTNNNVNLIHLDVKDEMISLQENTSASGNFVFVIHYYQPDYPGFDVKILIDNGQTYEAKVHIAHCPSHAGCYTAVEKQDGSKYFTLNEKFLFTLKKLNHTSLWLEHLILVSEENYEWEIQPHNEETNLSNVFITHCGKEGFYISNDTSEFCQELLFSITTLYNEGPLSCQCDKEGSESSTCKKFGGQCVCKANVIGRKCEHCKIGYFSFPECTPCDCPYGLFCHPENGSCICPPYTTGEKCEKCSEFTYGHDASRGCMKCNCNALGVEGNQLQCDVESGKCKCQENIQGRTCNECKPGFSSFPTCKKCSCSLAGTMPQICDKDTGRCICRKHVTDNMCDVCKEGTFNLDENNPDGCTPCFCFNRTKNCSSSLLSSSKVIKMEDWHLAEMHVVNGIIPEKEMNLKPFKKELKMIDNGVRVSLTSKEAFERVIYFVAPSAYLGNRISSYGGTLNYTLNSVDYTIPAAAAVMSEAADVILYGANVYLFHHSTKKPSSDLNVMFTVDLTERNFKQLNETNLPRDIFMQTIQNLSGLFIRVPTSDKLTHISLSHVILETADTIPNAKIKKALSVEYCSCPENYKGLSCEECAPGYYHTIDGKYGGKCIPCQCNEHSDMCDPHTGICLDCKHNTTGDHCEKCKKGHYGHPTRGTPYDCKICACPLTIPSNNFAEECELLEDGISIKCGCAPEYNGSRCELCALGYYGRPEVPGEVCKPCDCSGNINSKEHGSCDPVTGRCIRCLNYTYGDNCDQCAPGYYGDAIHLKNCEKCSCDSCGASSCHASTGACGCKENVTGKNCNHCALNHWNFSSCQGCIPCNCQPASESQQCDLFSGHCKCRTGVTGMRCDQCAPGYWNYTENGCTPCDCNEKYSNDSICDVKTGYCQCSKNLIGEKCDHCQERWMLVPEEGCWECDQCIHTLLDDSDYSLISNSLLDLRNLKEEYLANQKITFINETASELLPLLTFPTHFDTQMFADEISILKEGSTKLNKMVEILNGKMVKLEYDGLEIHKEVMEAEVEINKTIVQLNETIRKAGSLTFNIIETDAEYIKEAQNLLERINEFDLRSQKNLAIKEFNQSKKYLDVVQEIMGPVSIQIQTIESTKKKVLLLLDKIEELKNHSMKCKERVDHASQLKNTLGIPQLKTKINILMNLSKEANVALTQAQLYLKNATEIWNGIESVKENLSLTKEKLTQLINLIKTRISSNEKGLKGLTELVNKTKDHVNNLIEKGDNLSDLFSNVQNTSEQAVQAANAYKNIVKAIGNAMKTAEHAESAADEALSLTEGVSLNSVISGERSSNLFLNGMDLINITQNTLMPKLKMCQDQLDGLYKQHQQNNESMKNINGTLQTILSQDTRSVIENASTVADEARKLSGDALPKITSIGEKTPSQLVVANKLEEILTDVTSNISLAKIEGKRLSKKFPELLAMVGKVEKKQTNVKKTQEDLTKQINKLQEQINHARDQIKRIHVGVQLRKDHQSILVLRNPPNLLDTSGRISLYFRTNETDGLLLYLGNEVGTSMQARAFKTDDYMALEIKGGFPTLTIDMGSGPTVMKIYKNVDDNNWYQIIAKRYGKSMEFSLLEESEAGGSVEVVKHSDDAVLPGSSSILNLDQDMTRLIVGGYPPEFKISSEVANSYFTGEIEDLYIGEYPVSLWNYILAKNINGAKQRDKLIMLQPETGLRFEGEGYAILNWTTYTMKTRNTIQLKFRTSAKDGLLFLVEKEGSFLSIELVNGKIIHQFNLGDRVVSLRSKKIYNDDAWNSVEATRQKKLARLKVNEDDVVYGSSEGKAEYLVVSDYIYFGGYPGKHNIPQVTQKKFDGCIDDVEIESTIADLSRNIKAFGITSGCPKEVNNVASFVKGHNGYIRWTDIRAEEYFQLSFSFKTTQENALLFHVTDSYQINSISLNLVNGILILNGPQSKMKASSDPIKYNDDTWHAVTATYESNSLILEIDDYRQFKSEKRSPGLRMNPGDIYFGGVPDGFKNKNTHVHNQIPYIGCIRDATFDSALISFANASEIHNIILGRCAVSGNMISKQRAAHFQGQLAYNTPDEGCSLPRHSVSDPHLVAINGYRFGTKHHSYLAFQKPPRHIRHKYKFEMEFKTSEKKGIIFYLANHSHRKFIALYYHHGKLLHQLDCGIGKESKEISGTWNDGIWHTLALTCHKHSNIIVIDKKQRYTVNMPSCNNNTWMKNASSYFLGGIPRSIKVHVTENLGLHNSFSGCLRNFHDNAEEVFQPNVAHDLIPCSEQVENGIFFSAEGGYIIIDEKFKVGYTIVIEMEIKPRSSSGILLSIHGIKDYMVLQMYKGAVLFNVDNGKGNISIEYVPSNRSLLCDGEWHSIKAIKNRNVVSLSVDSTDMSPVYGPTGKTETDTHDPLFLGGHAHMRVKKNGLKPRRQFVGCIRNIVINSNAINMDNVTPVGNVTMGVCPTV